ncbi:hypothetical protein MNBD_ALPHA04-2185 [hydrothermal vent metagenome]|uniref:N-acetyltransferase domain-containing protein n=1 Tax=hydrothermal vent metagenome TaxID=652676 RepID=A0A3B0T701_9ZZZZ
MTDQWKIRKADDADAERLALIGAATFLESFAGILDGDAIVEHCKAQHDARTYHGYLANGGSAWLAEISDGGAPVGLSLLTKPDIPGGAADGSDLELKRIYAFSRFHGGGLGAALLEPVIEAARLAGAKRLLLGVYAENARAIGFYGKHGFAQIGDRNFQIGHKTYYDVVLAKQL